MLGLWLGFPVLIRQYAPLIVAGFMLGAASQIVCYVRYHCLASFHTWLSKLAGMVTGITFLSLLGAKTCPG